MMKLLILLSKLLILIGHGSFQNRHLLICLIQVESHLLNSVLQIELLLADDVSLKLGLLRLYLSSVTFPHSFLVLFLKHVYKASFSL